MAIFKKPAINPYIDLLEQTDNHHECGSAESSSPARPKTLSLLPHSRSASQLLPCGSGLLRCGSASSDPCTPSVRALVQVLEGKIVQPSTASLLLPSGAAAAAAPAAASACVDHSSSSVKPPVAPGLRAIRTAAAAAVASSSTSTSESDSPVSKDEGYSTMSSDVQVGHFLRGFLPQFLLNQFIHELLKSLPTTLLITRN